MKCAAFTISGVPGVGSVNEIDQTVSVWDVAPEEGRLGVLSLIGRDAPPPVRQVVSLEKVDLNAPVPKPRRNIFCVGKNYHDHAREFSASGFDSSAATGVVSADPIVFSKVPESVIAHGTPVVIRPKVSTAIDYESELAVILGKKCQAVSREQAMEAVWGYTIVNDVTARDLQKKHSQWLIGKSQDSFCPMGPWAVTRDELDLGTGGIRGFVNGEKRQDAKFSQLIFDIPTIIAVLSAGITLYPGDIIATGTPAGVGIGFDPPKYLSGGDTVRIEVDGLGILENPVIEK